MKSKGQTVENVDKDSSTDNNNSGESIENKSEIVQDILHNNVPDDKILRLVSSSTTTISPQITSSVWGVSRVAEGLLVAAATALRPGTLAALGVACVVNATSELPDTPLPDDPNTRPLYLRVPLLDRADADVAPYLDLVADTIEQVRQTNGTTLVHCVAGVSRSVTLCLAYLMKYGRMSLRSAYMRVKDARACVKPNAGFFRQLMAYERALFDSNSVHFVYNAVTNSHIPDVYETDYEHMLSFQKKYKNTCFVGRH